MTNESIEAMDSNILLSIINMKLRDNYSTLELLCDDLNLKSELIIDKLSKIGYSYNRSINQFK